MTYATYEEYIAEYRNDDLPDDEGQSRVISGITRASHIADAYIRSSGLAVPLTDSTAIGYLKGHILDIARYFVWHDSPNEEKRRRYEDAIKFLEGIAAGKIKIATSDGVVSSGSGMRIVRLIRG